MREMSRPNGLRRIPCSCRWIIMSGHKKFLLARPTEPARCFVSTTKPHLPSLRMRWHRGRDPGCRTNWSLLMQLVVHHRPGRADRDDVAQTTIPADIVVAPQRAELVLCTRAATQVATGGSTCAIIFHLSQRLVKSHQKASAVLPSTQYQWAP